MVFQLVEHHGLAHREAELQQRVDVFAWCHEVVADGRPTDRIVDGFEHESPEVARHVSAMPAGTVRETQPR